jgi:hypothetical protein
VAQLVIFVFSLCQTMLYLLSLLLPNHCCPIKELKTGLKFHFFEDEFRCTREDL